MLNTEMSSAMILFNEPTSRNSVVSPKSMLSTPIEDILRAIESMDSICATIRSHRHLGNITTALDNLQSTFAESRHQILSNIVDLHERYGNTLDDYSDDSVNTLHDCSKQLVNELVPKLGRVAFRQNISNPYSSQYGAPVENSHFGDITQRFRGIDRVIHDTVNSISQRMEGKSGVRSALRSPEAPLRGILKKAKPDQTTVNTKALEGLTDHAKNSWFQQMVGGRTVYVNSFDESITRHERPENAFIKELNIRGAVVHGLTEMRLEKERLKKEEDDDYERRLRANRERYRKDGHYMTSRVIPDERGNQWWQAPIRYS